LAKNRRSFFRAADNRELTENWTILGRFPAAEFKEGQFQVTFVFPGASPAERSLLQPLFQPVLREYLRIFPLTPVTHRLFAFSTERKKTARAF
jgi:hypothetical protein